MGSETRQVGLGCRKCQSCKSGCFSEVIDLKGIKIYKHESSIDSVPEEVGSKDEDASISYILHNTRGSAIHSGDIQSPLEEAYISCPRCRAILQHAQKLLTRIPSIGKNVVIGICDHCKIQQSLIKTCKKCARVIREFLDSREVDYASKEKTIMPWLSTIQKALQNELVKSAATATSHESKVSRGEPKDLAHKMLIDQRQGFDPAKTPRDGHIKLTCTPCESRSMEPMIDLDKSPFMDFDFLKRKLEKTKPDFAEFSKQHKVSIQEPRAVQLREQEKWPSMYHSEESLVSVATSKPPHEEGKEATVMPPAPRKSSLKKHGKLRFVFQARKYHSDEYLNDSRNVFQYIFPGEQKKEEHQEQISSSELIKTTLERFKEKKVQQDEENLKELKVRNEKQLTAKEERKRKQQSPKDKWETSTDISREEKSCLYRKGSLAEGYVRIGEEEIGKPLSSDDERKNDISEKGDRVRKDTGYKGGQEDKPETNIKEEKGGKIEKGGKDSTGGTREKSKGGISEMVENRGKDDTSGTAGKGSKYGTSETEGKDGKNGTSGTKGKDGTTTNGKDGISGTGEKDDKGRTSRTRGMDGKDRTSGIGGIDGKDGTSGTGGMDGKNGTGGKDDTKGMVGKRSKDETNRTVGKREKDGTSGPGRKRSKDDISGMSEKGGKDETSGTREKVGRDRTTGKGGKDRTIETAAKRGKDGTTGMDAKGYKDGISAKDETKMGKVDKEKRSGKEANQSKEIKESSDEQEDLTKVPPKGKKKLSNEKSTLVVKEGETDKPLTKSEKEEALKRKQEYDKQVREMKKYLKANEQADDSSKYIQVQRKPDKVMTKLKEESASKRPTDKEVKERSELKRKEELEKKLKEYGDVKGTPLLRVVTEKDKKESTEHELRLTKSQQLLVLKRQREDLDLMRQLEERRKVKAHEIVIPITSPTTKRDELLSSTQIVQVKHEEEKESEEEFEAFLDKFNRDSYKPTEIIVDTNVYKYTKELETDLVEEEKAPALYKVKAGGDISKDLHSDVIPVEKSKPKIREGENRKGVTSYALSDRTFIEKGWTMLPTEKIVRKMNIYSMSPAQPQFDWFERNRSKGTLFYDNGDRLAEFEDNKTARWYYRNRRPALEYYEAEELNANQRIVVHSSGEPDDKGRNYPITILATFDYLGNGIVFDHTGKIRLKYNQTEGVMLDRTLGPVTKWKWHSLNDPPILQQVMIDNELPVKDEKITHLGSPSEDRERPDNEQMLVIEYDNYIKEKNKKVTKKFKPFQIKMKALKINENFSLRVLDQANVILLFRDGTTSMKLNLGMKLNNKEIIDSDEVEVGFVANPMQKLPAKSDSLARMQLCLSQNQQFERARLEQELKIRPVLPMASVDRMHSAVSRKLRSPFPQGSSARTETTTDADGNLQYHYRKPCVCNVFYANQLI